MTENQHPSDAPRVDHYLAALAAESPPPLPNAAQLRWRADTLRRLDARDARTRQATRPLRWAMVAALAVLGLGLSIWAFTTFVGDGSPSRMGWIPLLGLASWMPTLVGGAWLMRSTEDG